MVNVLRFVVLSCLKKKPIHAYALMAELKKRNIRVSASTLYPALHKLEHEGLVTGKDAVFERRRRIVYCLTAKGMLACTAANIELKMFVLPLLTIQ